MRFASVRIAEEYKHHIDPALRGLLEEAQDFAESLYQWNLLITCLLRTPEENDACYAHDGTHRDGVHVHGRGADIRTRDVDGDNVRGLLGFLNEKFIYDPERPKLKVALYETFGIGSTAPHLHLQVHPNTRNRYVAEED